MVPARRPTSSMVRSSPISVTRRRAATRLRHIRDVDDDQVHRDVPANGHGRPRDHRHAGQDRSSPLLAARARARGIAVRIADRERRDAAGARGPSSGHCSRRSRSASIQRSCTMRRLEPRPPAASGLARPASGCRRRARSRAARDRNAACPPGRCRTNWRAMRGTPRKRRAHGRERPRSGAR